MTWEEFIEECESAGVKKDDEIKMINFTTDGCFLHFDHDEDEGWIIYG